MRTVDLLQGPRVTKWTLKPTRIRQPISSFMSTQNIGESCLYYYAANNLPSLTSKKWKVKTVQGNVNGYERTMFIENENQL